MALPINIDKLISGETVEWERIEFKEGWNPQSVLHSICAFANDFNNWGGGYIILGIASEKGMPILPPVGLEANLIDSIQLELNQLCRRILPNYFPLVEPVDFRGKKILILWCPGGSTRPYKAPDKLGKESQYYYYIRRFSATVKATRDNEYELISMTNQVPYDDRTNMRASVADFDLSGIKEFLDEIKSTMKVSELSVNELARRMNIVEGPDEYLLPKNAGLLFFGKNPQYFFPSAKIEIVRFSDDAGSEFTEKIFGGPLHQQLRSALNYIRDAIIEEKIIKRPGQAEADRYFNYPYQAIEETLANAVYHRSYSDDSPIEVKIFPSHIDIISFPGPLPPLNRVNLQMGKFIIRKYRNRRIGEFLKEIHLTEGRGTGIPTILKELEKNGSPKPIFETDDARSYFLATIKIHPSFRMLNFSKADSMNLPKYSGRILEFCLSPKTRFEIFEYIGLSNQFINYKAYIVPLLEKGLLSFTIPDKVRSRNQKYFTTETAKDMFNS
ncbi:MAG: RNA-binding domain-containing protein [Syntrophomonadaceae bacterium]